MSELDLKTRLEILPCGTCEDMMNCDDCYHQKEAKDLYQQIRADMLEEFDRICEEARSHKFGVCDADFIIDVIKAKVKEQLKNNDNCEDME